MHTSTGPRTPEGKAISSQNALRHGFRSAQIVLPGEDLAAFEALEAELTRYHQPTCPTTLRAVREMAAAEWRLNRARTQIHHLLTTTIQTLVDQDPNTDPTIHQATAHERLLAESPYFRQLLRFEDKFDRQYHRALNLLSPKRRISKILERLFDTNELPPTREATQKYENEPSISENNTQMDTNELPTEPHMTQNGENEPRPIRVISRNAPCPCRSGIKYKRCCGKALAA